MKRTVRRLPLLLLVAFNAVLMAMIALAFIAFNAQYGEKLKQENLSNIVNLNQSSATIASSYFEGRQLRLADVVWYAVNEKLTPRETLDYIHASVFGDAIGTFELIGPERVGWVARQDSAGEYPALDYSHNDFKRLIAAFKGARAAPGSVVSTPEFTDADSAVRSFALCAHLSLADEQGVAQDYSLLLVSKSKEIISAINLDGGYEGMSAVLIDDIGDYVLSSSDFKSTNFFDFLYNYNSLTLDQKNALAADLARDRFSTLYYKNSRGQDCVFVCSPVAGYDWYCVTSVPMSSFHKGETDMSFTLFAIGALLVILVVDVIWLARLNWHMKRSRDREQQANRAKTEFLSRMSHDMRTPMNAILGLTHLMKEKTDLREIRGDLDQVSLSGRYLLNLINDTLDMSRIENGRLELHPKPIDSEQLFMNIIGNARLMAADQGVQLRTDCRIPGGRPWVNVVADAARLEQIFMNLISNAIKYTHAGKLVELILIPLGETEEKVTVRCIVQDQGIGMSEEFLPHLFEPFAQEGRVNVDRKSGTGLGMSIVKSVVDLMDGRIWVESKLNEGTRVTVEFCCEIYRGEVANHERAAVPTEALKGRHVLLIEDNAMNRIVATRLLGKYGVSIDEAVNGQLGVEAFEKSPLGGYDAVLMDVMMPVMDGYAATRAIRALNRADAATVPILAMTANAFAEDVEKCMQSGMNAHIAKPIEPERLYRTLAENLAPRSRTA